MTREELLSEWARLAPGENLGFLAFVASDADPRGPAPATVAAVLLSALISAIRAREDWSMEIRLDSDGAVEATVKDGARPAHYGDLPEPCDSLLRAYVQALQAAEEGK